MRSLRPLAARLSLVMLAAMLPLSHAWAQGEAEERASVAVARFPGDDLGSGNLPEVSTLLAAALAGAPIRVVPPELFGAAPESAAGDAAALAAWAQGAAVDLFVTGRVLRFGERLSIHTRLRSAQSGEVVETFVEEVPRDEDRMEGISGLAEQILRGVERSLEISLAEGDDSEDGEDDASQSTLRVGGDDPIEIQSEEIEVIPQTEGGRNIVFTTAVVAQQGAMRLETDRLEAIYPPDEDAPGRYVATGNVRMHEDRGGEDRNRTMLCDRAVLYQAEDRLVCTGNAELREGGDRVSGNEIEILFARDVVKVRGGAFLNLGEAPGE